MPIRSPSDDAHVGVALAGGRAAGRRLLEALEVLVAQLDLGRGEVLLQVLHALRARDRDDVLALTQQPRERELRRGDVLLLRDLEHALDELEVALEVLAHEARRAAAVVVGREVLGGPDLAGEEPAAERAVGDEADTEL